MAKEMRAVVVGGAGFIGSHVVDACLKEGWTVDVIDNLVAGKKENLDPAATLHVLDIRDYDAIAPVIAGADRLFHLAALPRVQYSIEHPRDTNDTNVNGTLNVLLAAKEGKVGRVVYSASSSAYGDQETMPLREDMLPAPVSPYGLQKYVGEHYARIFTMNYGLPTVSLRYFNVYGPRLDANGAYALVMGIFLKQRSEGKPLTITGDGEQTRDFTHVRDVARANILAATGERAGNGEVINIGAGQNISINALAKMFGGPIEYLPARSEPRHTLADTEKARVILGWKPEVVLRDGVRELLEEWGIASSSL